MSTTLRNDLAENVRFYLAKHTIPLTGENPSQMLDAALDIEYAAGAAEAAQLLRELRAAAASKVRTAAVAEIEAKADAFLARQKAR